MAGASTESSIAAEATKPPEHRPPPHLKPLGFTLERMGDQRGEPLIS
jgi:hypothetical protein